MNKERIEKGLRYKYIHNKKNKNNKNNISIINTNLKTYGINYSNFKNLMIKMDIQLNNNILSNIILSEFHSIKSYCYLILKQIKNK